MKKKRIYTWKAIFISPHIPFNRNVGSELKWVNLHRCSNAPQSSSGSFAGENSSSKLHNVETRTFCSSNDAGSEFINSISGRHTMWSWKAVRSNCTDLDNECRHFAAASRTSGNVDFIPASISFIKLSFSITLLRISSSLEHMEAMHLNALCKEWYEITPYLKNNLPV